MKIANANEHNLPAPNDTERVQIRAEAIMDVLRHVGKALRNSPDIPELKAMSADLDAVAALIPQLLADLDTLCRPATKQEIADHLSIMTLNFHNSKSHSEGFATVMINRVAAKQPTYLMLDWAIRGIIDSVKYKFLPVTSEVLAAMDEAADRLTTIRDWFAGIERRRSEISRIIAIAEARDALRIARAS